MMNTARDLAEWMKARVAEASARGIVVGLSGGIDSAVVIGLAAMAAPGRTIGVIMPCHSDPVEEEHGRLVAEHFGVPAIEVDLSSTYDHLLQTLGTATADLPQDQRPAVLVDTVDLKQQLPQANLKPRLRMTTLYYVANGLDYLVAGTGNRCELTIGYFTKYGDGGVDILPLGRLLKSQVREIARDIGVPAAVIDKAPSAGLWLGQTDEGEMGFTYAELERYLTLGPDAVSPALGMRIERLARKSDHKRALPPMPPEER
jgi:NAD+ synthase